MAKRKEIVDTAREALGTPWKHMGRVVPFGVDCIGLVLYVVRKLRITDYEPPPYPRNAEWGKFIRYFRQNLKEIPIPEARAGDIVCFRQNIYPCHCGIISTDGADPHFVHSYLLRKKVVEERYSADWHKRVVAAFEIPGIED